MNRSEDNIMSRFIHLPRLKALQFSVLTCFQSTITHISYSICKIIPQSAIKYPSKHSLFMLYFLKISSTLLFCLWLGKIIKCLILWVAIKINKHRTFKNWFLGIYFVFLLDHTFSLKLKLKKLFPSS